MVLLPIFITFLSIQVSTQHSINPRIINGVDAKPDQFPFIAFIESFPVRVPFTADNCVGVVIDEYWIFSTGVCAKSVTRLGSKGRVKINKYFTNKDSDTVQVIGIARTFIHKQFTWKILSNRKKVKTKNYWTFDVALLLLDDPIKDPVIATLASGDIHLYENIFIAGWGKTSSGTPKVLQYGIVRLLEKSICKDFIKEEELSIEILDSQLCMYSPAGIVTGYIGDNGGPMVQYINEKPEVIGILSWTMWPAAKKTAIASLGSSVPYFRKWITDTMNIGQPNATDTNSVTAPLLV